MNRLVIYVSLAGCGPCSRAREIGASLVGVYPHVEVEVIDLGAVSPDRVPEAVVAVPTYLLDGIVISMGNPHESTLREKLAAAVLAGG